MLIIGHEWQFDWNRAVGKNHMFRLNDDCILSFTDFDGLCVLEFSPSSDEFCSCVLEQVLNPLLSRVTMFSFHPTKVCHVEFSRAWELKCPCDRLLRVLCKVVEPVCGMNECFGWNATANEAGASCFFTLNDDG